ncbi:hypothetical protein [Parenemella sanctibonifatiensis]|uniref:Uncharacterized protein n=1 Tax=Parenemella sanctibonifatiensis TaxID=2016505 RepID=A0A255ERC9_9ACTN|nr:hypothetical protein [Parenemella sanctibonifatiensis]OYN90683.1 hypothetical protein CGZ92_00610 [Parenemella sanctibonifatiensis]
MTARSPDTPTHATPDAADPPAGAISSTADLSVADTAGPDADGPDADQLLVDGQPPPSARTTLSRDRIVQAAVEFVDEHGLPGLSMPWELPI